MKLRIGYTNYRGEYSERTIEPLRLIKKESHWHGEGKHIILEAIEEERGVARDFLVKDIVFLDNVFFVDFKREK